MHSWIYLAKTPVRGSHAPVTQAETLVWGLCGVHPHPLIHFVRSPSRFRGLSGHRIASSIFEMSPKPAKRDIGRSVTELPAAKSEGEKGNEDVNGDTGKRECVSATWKTPAAVGLHWMWVQCRSPGPMILRLAGADPNNCVSCRPSSTWNQTAGAGAF